MSALNVCARESADERLHPGRMDYRMQAGDNADNGIQTLRIGERHRSGTWIRYAEIAKAI